MTHLIHKAHAVEAVYGEFEDTKSNFRSNFDVADYQEEFSTACKVFSESLARISSTTRQSTTAGSRVRELGANERTRWPVDKSQFRNLAVEWKEADETDEDSFAFASSQYEHHGNGQYSAFTGFLANNDRVYYTFATFNLTWSWDDLQRFKMTFPDMWDVYYDLNKATKAAEDATGLSGGIHSVAIYDWMVASKVFLESALTNAAIALFVAFVVIASMTLNYKLTGLVFTGLFVILAMVCLLMTLCGWKIGIIEAVGISVATGMSVDYVLHLSHAYNHQPAGLAPDRVRGAQEMSVFSAAAAPRGLRA